MEDKQQQEQTTPILHREISRRWMEIILVLSIILFLFFVLIAPTSCGHGHDHRPTQDMSNIRHGLMVMVAFAVDNDGMFPSHIHLAADYHEEDDSLFKSPYDHEESLIFDATITPGWYPYGSYWFLSTDRFTLDSDIEAPLIILAYRTPRLDNDYYLVGFLDGHAEVMESEAFDELMDKQDELISQPNDLEAEPNA